jgi:acetolactate synthase small subunit
MPRAGSKTITVPEEELMYVQSVAAKRGTNIKEVVLNAIDCTYRKNESDLLREELERMTKILAQTEDDLQTMIKFVNRKHPQDAKVLASILNTKNTYKTEPNSVTSIFGQGDSEMSTEDAIWRIMNAKPVNKDPLSRLEPAFKNTKNQDPRKVYGV